MGMTRSIEIERREVWTHRNSVEELALIGSGTRRDWILPMVLALSCVSTWGLMTRDEALEAAFPGAQIQAQRLFLTQQQLQTAQQLAGVKVPSALIARYLARRAGNPIGRAYVDTHVVRTKKESLLICLDAQGRVQRIEVTAFLEPPEYLAPPAWLQQYNGNTRTSDLNLKRSIRPLAGATLTTQATQQAVRRILAIDHVLQMEKTGGTQ